MCCLNGELAAIFTEIAATDTALEWIELDSLQRATQALTDTAMEF